MKKFIIESKTHGRHTVIIDKEDWEKVSKLKWKLRPSASNKFTVLGSSPRIKGASLKHFLTDSLISETGVVQKIIQKNKDWRDHRKSNLCVLGVLITAAVKLNDNTMELVSKNSNGEFKILIDVGDWEMLKNNYENVLLAALTERKRKNRYTRRTYVHAYFGPQGSRQKMSLHRLLTDCPKGMVVDHINGDPLDNRRSNLRICTNAENSRNARRVTTSSTGYKGVHSAKANGSKLPWRARIKHNYKEIQLGTFATKIDAAKAYDKRAKELFGEFAYLNFPEETN